jgi:hypothetical protein
LITPIGQTRSSSAPTNGTDAKPAVNPAVSPSVNASVNNEARLHSSGEAAPSTFFWLSCALCYCLAISLSIKGSTLWTDEAFSAWAASHRSLGSLFHSLRIGDSSDLQVGAWYIYLFGWARLFGHGELALRAANIPFAFLFSLALVWGSVRIFLSRWAWLPAGILPFIWQFASEVRAYMAILAFSAVSVAMLSGFLRSRTSSGGRRYVWLLLASALLGSLFHMLFLLVVLPLATLAFVYSAKRPGVQWREWRLPLAVFALPFAALASFMIWTFTRADILYDYPKPGIRQMLSVASEIAGFTAFGPNRKFSLDFAAFGLPLALGGAALLAGFATAVFAGLRKRHSAVTSGLASALCAGCIETVALACLTHKQPDARHLAALVPLFLFLLMGVITQTGRAGYVAALLFGGAWLAADVRVAVLPEYQKEDFRGAVAAAVSMHNQTGAEIAVASDPVGAAYYGLDVKGDSPCYPFTETCSSALDAVNWTRGLPAHYAARWSRPRIASFLRTERLPIVVIMPMDRSRRGSPWFSILADHPEALREHLHGFDVVLLSPPRQ